VNYAKASDIARILQEGASSTQATGTDEAASGDADAILSDRASVAVDDRTNILIIKDTAENLERVRELIVLLDVPVRQVMIESRIVIASDDFAKDLGIKFGAAYTDGDSSIDNKKFGGIGGNQGAVEPNDAAGLEALAGLGGLLVNLPAPSPAGSLGVVLGKAGSYVLGLALSAMQTEGRGEIISNPRVVTSEKKEATISQGVQIPVQTRADDTVTTEFVDATLELKVTPQITPDDRIIMDLEVKKDNPDFASRGPLDPAPPIDTRSVKTNVQVADGETLVLGGVYETSRAQAVTKVPFFGDLPTVGAMFRSRQTIDEKNELLIFVTPKILEDLRTSR
ncbi:MAG TPA: type IV pilus secretin PilQ, partial [Gammaproteobacteria bacterium]